MPTLGKRFAYLGDSASAAGGSIPPNFTGTATRDDLNTALSPGVVWTSANSSWGSLTGVPNLLMTSAVLPAPYTVTGEQPANEALPSTAVVEWDAAAFGALSAQERSYLTTFANGYHSGNTASPAYRREVLGDSSTLREPRRIIYGGPARRIGSYAIKSAFNGREPLAWTLKGANSSTGPWTTLDSRSHTAGNQVSNPLMNAAQVTFNLPDLSLLPPSGFTHYMLEFTKVYPVPSGSSGYIDLNRIIFYEVGYRMQSLPRLYPAPISRATFTVRLAGRPALRADEVSASATRETALINWKPLSFYIANVLADGSIVMTGECDLSDLAAQNQLAVKLTVPYTDVRVTGWSFSALQ